MIRKPRLVIFIAAIAAVFLMVIVLPRDNSLTKLQQAGVIRIGYAVEAPYAFLKPGGEVTGAEPEVAKIIVKRLGIERIEWHLYEFCDLIPELEAGRIDAISAGMFITSERAKHVSFSEPTFHVQEGLLVAAGNPLGIHSYEQAAKIPEIKIAVLTGSVEARLLKKLGMNASQLIHVPDTLTGLKAVETGAADGLALSALSIRWLALQDHLKRTEMAEPFEQSNTETNRFNGYGAVVFQQEDKQLRDAWNKELQSFLGSPEHLKLIESFGFTTNELPGEMSTKEIIFRP